MLFKLVVVVCSVITAFSIFRIVPKSHTPITNISYGNESTPSDFSEVFQPPPPLNLAEKMGEMLHNMERLARERDEDSKKDKAKIEKEAETAERKRKAQELRLEGAERIRREREEEKLRVAEDNRNATRETIFGIMVYRYQSLLRTKVRWEGPAQSHLPKSGHRLILDVSVDRKGKNFYIQMTRTVLVEFLDWALYLQLLYTPIAFLLPQNWLQLVIQLLWRDGAVELPQISQVDAPESVPHVAVHVEEPHAAVLSWRDWISPSRTLVTLGSQAYVRALTTLAPEARLDALAALAPQALSHILRVLPLGARRDMIAVMADSLVHPTEEARLLDVELEAQIDARIDAFLVLPLESLIPMVESLPHDVQGYALGALPSEVLAHALATLALDAHALAGLTPASMARAAARQTVLRWWRYPFGWFWW